MTAAKKGFVENKIQKKMFIISWRTVEFDEKAESNMLNINNNISRKIKESKIVA